MDNIEENKLHNFEQLIIKDAQEKRDAILRQVQQEKQEKLDKAKAEFEQKYKQNLSREMQKVDKVINEQNAAFQSAQKKEILNVREQHIDNVFNNVLTRINEYIKTDKYKEDFDQKIKKVIKNLSNDVTIIISNDDQKLKELNYKFETTEENFFGGCRIIDNNNGIQFDLSNVSKIEKLRSEFLEMHKLKL